MSLTSRAKASSLSRTSTASTSAPSGRVVSFGSIVIAAAAAMFERILQSAVDMKSENV
jgi:hypothetical protein